MAKGGSYEREVAKFLSLWWTQDEKEPSDAVFWRTSNSGGRATVRGKKKLKTKSQYGDLCATDPIGQPFIDCFTIEIKRGYSKLTIQDLLEGGKISPKVPSYANWIGQARRSHEGSGSMSWAIIHKRDKRNAIVTMPWSMTQLLALDADFHIRFAANTLRVPMYGVLASFQFDGFFECIKPKHIIQIVKAWKERGSK